MFDNVLCGSLPSYFAGEAHDDDDEEDDDDRLKKTGRAGGRRGDGSFGAYSDHSEDFSDDNDDDDDETYDLYGNEVGKKKKKKGSSGGGKKGKSKYDSYRDSDDYTEDMADFDTATLQDEDDDDGRGAGRDKKRGGSGGGGDGRYEETSAAGSLATDDSTLQSDDRFTHPSRRGAGGGRVNPTGTTTNAMTTTDGNGSVASSGIVSSQDGRPSRLSQSTVDVIRKGSERCLCV